MQSKAAVTVRQIGTADPLEFEVSIIEPKGQSQHWVRLAMSDYRRLAPAAADPGRCVTAAFRFLLDREPKEAIHKQFNPTLIGHYFPEFESLLPAYLAVREP